MKGLTLKNIALACNGTYYGNESLGNTEVSGVVIDSRQVEKNFLYIPIIGEKVDGHKFIDQVYENGALAVLSMVELHTDKPYILVSDTKESIKDVARLYREATGIKVIGITGSVGKTSTKEFIASVLAEKYNVLKTEANFNNEIGLPLTVFKIKPEHEIAILEMGIDSFGEMHRLSSVAKPDMVVMTNIGTCHLENLGDRDGVLRAKSEIFDFLSDDGSIILNGDDDKLSTLKDVHGIKPKFFGQNSNREIHAENLENLGFEGTNATLFYFGESIDVRIPLPGIHMVYNALAALTVGMELGMTLDEVKTGLMKTKAISGRVNLIETDCLRFMDDCYNANPMSMKASIDILKFQRGSRRVCLLGDMFELGVDEISHHEEVGRYAANAGIDLIICVGHLSKYMADAAKECGGNVLYFEKLDQLKSELPTVLNKGDTVIVKASHGMNFSEVVEMLKTLILEEK